MFGSESQRLNLKKIKGGMRSSGGNGGISIMGISESVHGINSAMIWFYNLVGFPDSDILIFSFLFILINLVLASYLA